MDDHGIWKHTPANLAMLVSSFPQMPMWLYDNARMLYAKHSGQEVNVVIGQTGNGCPRICTYNHMSFPLEHMG